jgi:hypothetical protein
MELEQVTFRDPRSTHTVSLLAVQSLAKFVELKHVTFAIPDPLTPRSRWCHAVAKFVELKHVTFRDPTAQGSRWRRVVARDEVALDWDSANAP